MISALGPSSSAAAPSGVALNAELAQCELKRSDWVHCVSAKTPRGEEKIAELDAKVDAIKARMAAADAAEGDRSTADASRPLAGLGMLGHGLNVYA